MTEKRCSKCQSTKPVSEFNGNKSAPDGFSYWCRPCAKAAYDERRNGSKAKATRKAPKAAAPAAKPEPAAALAVTMAPGFGFEAAVDENGVLRISQPNEEGADEIVLSRTEAKVLFAQFHDWVHG